MKKIAAQDIVLGAPIPFSIYDERHILLYRQGSVISMPYQITRLVTRGALYDEHEVQGQPADASRLIAPVEEEVLPFEHLSGLILNLKHVLLTTLKSPEQINVPQRIGKIALAVQSVCMKDIDSALAAPCLDTGSAYIVVHQMMGAVLTELIAQSKGLDAAQRLPLVCAALTRDLSQIPLQVELDQYEGPLPADLRTKMRLHPVQSADLLARVGVLDPVWLQAVRGHHEHLGGQGYPVGLHEDQVSLGARILAVADTYSAMLKSRPYRTKAHFSQNALKEIYLKKDVEMDGEIARILISRVGLLSPGTLVRLKCGEIAVVKSPTVKADAATVYSVYGKSGMILAAPIRRDTSQPGYEITGLVPFADCHAAAICIRRVWTQ